MRNIAPGVCPLTISDLVTSYCFILLCLKMVTINLRSIKIRWQAATQLVCMRCMMNQTPWDCFKIQFCSWNDLFITQVCFENCQHSDSSLEWSIGYAFHFVFYINLKITFLLLSNSSFKTLNMHWGLELAFYFLE